MRSVYGIPSSARENLLESSIIHTPCDHRPSELVQCGQTPYPMPMRPYTLAAYMHFKTPYGRHIVATGEGAGCWPELLARLRADGYDGFLD